MEREIRNTDKWGKVLWLTGDKMEIGVALEFGIRVVHLSCPGMENLFYEQPNDLSDGFYNRNGWRIFGGHRILMSPESSLSYSGDNDPVDCATKSDAVMIVQGVDYALNIQKMLKITFLEDGGVALENGIKNVGRAPLEGATWGINTLSGGGKADISFEGNPPGNCIPKRVVSLWGDTNLHDSRITFTRNGLTAVHQDIKDYFKIGLYCDPGKAVYENKGQRLTLAFDAPKLENLPDNGCNFELYMCDKFMELETLGEKFCLESGEFASHTEVWHLEKL